MFIVMLRVIDEKLSGRKKSCGNRGTSSRDNKTAKRALGVLER